MTKSIILLMTFCFAVLIACCSTGLAQVNGPGPSPANLFDTVLNLPGDEAVITGAESESIGGMPGQTTQLNLADGGTVGSFFDANAGSEVNISGGTVDDFFRAESGSEVNISGGAIENFFQARSGSNVNISGGSIGFVFFVNPGSDVNISGGTFADNFRVLDGSDVELIGGDFRLNGVDFTDSTIFITDDDVLTGTLADGSPFIISDAADRIDENLTLTVVPVPPVDLDPIVVDDPVSGPSGLRAGQTLTLAAGGVLGRNFAVIDATLNVRDGIVESGIEVIGSLVNISGGTIGIGPDVYDGSVVNISGGYFDGGLDAFNGSVLTVSGGTFGDFDADIGSDVELIGGEFCLNGVEISDSTISVTDDDFLTGTLADGSPFIFSETAGDIIENLTLTVVPVPPADLSPILVDDTVSGPSGLRAGQTLTLVTGGTLGMNFGVVDATLNVEGGVVDNGVNTYNSLVDISGGTFGDDFFALDGSVVNISGGTFGERFGVFDGSEVNISGGNFANDFVVTSLFNGGLDGGIANISGGVFREIEVFNAGVVNVSGGTIGIIGALNRESVVNISGGTVSSILQGSFNDGTMNIYGSEFFIDGLELDTLIPGEAFTITDRDVTLSGLLIDGEPFSFEILSVTRDFTITVTLGSPVILGDVNMDSAVNFLDISPFIGVLSSGAFQAEADINGDGGVNFLDISPFIQLLINQ